MPEELLGNIANYLQNLSMRATHCKSPTPQKETWGLPQITPGYCCPTTPLPSSCMGIVRYVYSPVLVWPKPVISPRELMAHSVNRYKGELP